MPITPRTISAAENSRQNPAESPKKSHQQRSDRADTRPDDVGGADGDRPLGDVKQEHAQRH